MYSSRTKVLHSDLGLLILLALARFVLHLLTNSQYGFHRDELATLDDAHHLAWGYVAYPPVTPVIARVALTLFGPSLVGVRLFAALAQSLSMVLAGLMARELGGSRGALVVTALAVAIAPVSLIMGAMFQYGSFDSLWWVVVAYLTLRLLNSADPRWWLGIGAAIGLGMMTKYTMGFLVAGLVGGVILTTARRDLKSPWLWGGVALALLIMLPNLLWQVQHHFISLAFLRSIHARDVQIGRTQGYLLEQLFVCANPVTIRWWLAGLAYYLFMSAGALPHVRLDVPHSLRTILRRAGPLLLSGPSLPDAHRGGGRRLAATAGLTTSEAGSPRLADGLGGIGGWRHARRGAHVAHSPHQLSPLGHGQPGPR
jgi:4-amino-4-deoxy-L-arabinose transferase-like glycosyltransferase